MSKTTVNVVQFEPVGHKRRRMNAAWQMNSGITAGFLSRLSHQTPADRDIVLKHHIRRSQCGQALVNGQTLLEKRQSFRPTFLPYQQLGAEPDREMPANPTAKRPTLVARVAIRSITMHVLVLSACSFRCNWLRRLSGK